MNRITQREQILHYMESYGAINPLIALEQIGCFRLATRIFELKKDGYDIKSYQHKYKNKMGQSKRYSIYYLADSEFAKHLEQ